MAIDLEEIRRHAPTVASMMGDTDTALHNLGLENHDAHLVIAVDLARTNQGAVGSGLMHLGFELLYALACSFDTDANVHVVGFGDNPVDIGVMNLGNAEEFFLRQMPPFDHVETNLETLMTILPTLASDDGLPTLVLVLTDGSIHDAPSFKTMCAARDLCGTRTFVQFIGHSSHMDSFEQMTTLDANLHPEFVRNDNIGFTMWPSATVVGAALLEHTLEEYALWALTEHSFGG